MQICNMVKYIYTCKIKPRFYFQQSSLVNSSTKYYIGSFFFFKDVACKKKVSKLWFKLVLNVHVIKMKLLPCIYYGIHIYIRILCTKIDCIAYTHKTVYYYQYVP